MSWGRGLVGRALGLTHCLKSLGELPVGRSRCSPCCSEMIMHQGSLEESVPKVRDVVAEWVGIRIQMSRHRNTCVIRDSAVTVVSSALETSSLR